MSMRKAVENGNGVGDQSKATARRRHQLTLKARENLAIDGVVKVESFHEQEVVVETDQGMMLIRGEGMHIKELNLEAGTLHLDGAVQLIEYAGDSLGKKSKGFLSRLFK